MFKDEDVLEGVSGRMGNVSGRIGDVSGRMGDVSGVEGHMGDVSGASTILEVKNLMFEDRRNDELACLAAKVARIENEILGVSRWLDARLRALEQSVARGSSLADRLMVAEGNIRTLDQRLDRLEGAKPPNGTKPPSN